MQNMEGREEFGVDITNAHDYTLGHLFINHHATGWYIYGKHVASEDRCVGAGDTLQEAWAQFYQRFAERRMCPECDGPTTQTGPCVPCQAKFSLEAPKLCPVCHDTVVKVYRLRCGHRGCRSCLVRWAESRPSPTCPECRKRYRINAGWAEEEGGGE